MRGSERGSGRAGERAKNLQCQAPFRPLAVSPARPLSSYDAAVRMGGFFRPLARSPHRPLSPFTAAVQGREE